MTCAMKHDDMQRPGTDDVGSKDVLADVACARELQDVLPHEEPVHILPDTDGGVNLPLVEEDRCEHFARDDPQGSVPVDEQNIDTKRVDETGCFPRVVIELCAGCARLSSVFASEGFTTLAVDYVNNRHATHHRVVHLDLRLDESWQLIYRILDTHRVVFVHCAPPCGSASRARDRPLSGQQWGPPPLRSDRYPWGLPHLTGKLKDRVEQANLLYIKIAAFCRELSRRNIPWCIENPRRSYLWELGPIVELQDVASFYDFQACMFGSERDKHTAFLSSLDFSEMCVMCDGSHPHKAWGIDEDNNFATAEEAEYPRELCDKVVSIVARHVENNGGLPESHFDAMRGPQRADATVQQQSRKKTPPIIPEFLRTMEVECDGQQPPLDAKGCLKDAFMGVPAGSKQLRARRKQVGTGKAGLRTLFLYGVYRSPEQFVKRALSIPHPFDQFCDVPDCLLKLMHFALVSGPIALEKHRLQKIQCWRQWAVKLKKKESELHDTMDEGTAKVLQGKNLLLLEKIAESVQWTDVNLVSDIIRGFDLVGIPDKSGIFPEEVNVPSMSVTQLDSEMGITKQVLWEKIGKAPFDQGTWDATVEEVETKGWLQGPFSWDELEEMFKGDWVPTRRFGIQQAGKLRVIDDLSENGTNSAYSPQEKLDLRTLDHMSWMALTLSRCIWFDKAVRFNLSDGSVLQGPVHEAWTSKDIGDIVTKTVDLKSAYKQYAISPGDRKRAVIVVKSGEKGPPMGFVGSVLPFGASASVLAFNRISRLLWRILVEAGVMCSAYFDDYPLVDLSYTAASSALTARAVFRLLGVKCSEDKEMDFSNRTSMLGVILDTSNCRKGECIISNKEERVLQLVESIDRTLEEGKIRSNDIPKLFGRLQFAEHQIAGRVGKLALADLRDLARRSNDVVLMDDIWKKAFGLLKFRLSSHTPRVVKVLQGNGVVVFTDGACEQDETGRYVATVGGVIYVDGMRPKFFGGKLSPRLVDKWLENKKHVIGLVELYAVVLARSVWAEHLVDRRVVYFVDNIPAMRTLIRGTSSEQDWRSVLLLYEELESVGHTFPWIARVPSKSNIADYPSRGEFGALGDMDYCTPVCLVTGERIVW